jgi:hypothetical protein
MVRQVGFILAINLLTACNSYANNTPNYIVLEEVALPKVLIETSGLYCPDLGEAYTVNDSGNKSIIYKIDDQGVILNRRQVDAKNKDWEALTGDKTHFYIGDVGNNNGKRKFVQIHALPKEGISTKVTTSKILYISNSHKTNENLNHDFDAEALVSKGDALFLFSKSWNTGTLFIYKLDKIMPEQLIEPTASIVGLPGMITGAEYDSKNNRFILVGYKLNGMGSFEPFIAILDKDLSVQKSFELVDYDQVEGVCVTPNGEVWFTQEGSFFSNHKMIKLKVAL